MPSTASAPKSRRIALQRPIEPQVFHRNGSIRGESVGGFATAGTVSKRRCEYFADASASTFFSEISSSTSCPRARRASATAMPGNRWPPVPPQAMRIFRDLDTGERVNSQSAGGKTRIPQLSGGFYANLDYPAILKISPPKNFRLVDCSACII